LVSDADLRRQMGAAGCERVRSHFTTNRMVTAIETVYRDVLRLW